jgi:hypothetical protein
MQLWESRPPGLEWPVLGLAVSHGISFVKNFLFGQEYLSFKINEIMIRPYKRIVLMHVAIIAGFNPMLCKTTVSNSHLSIKKEHLSRKRKF